jgi:5-methylcytosine-specific restriction protein B
MTNDNPVYAAARRVIDAGFAADDSAFTPGQPVWTLERADDLDKRFVHRLLTGGDPFIVKLGRQLADAPQATIQLAAELLYLHFLVPSDIGGLAKRKVIRDVLELMPEPPEIPADLDAALDIGFAYAGVAYLTFRDRQLAWLVRLLQAWKRLPEERRRRALADPWTFREVADSIDIGSAFSQRNGLLHLAFPDTFLDIVSRKHKTLIFNAFADEIPNPTGDEDRDLLTLRRTLERRTGRPVLFYRSPWVGRWQRADQRGWLVRGANVHGKNLIRDWLDNGYCSIAFPELEEVPSGLTKSQLDQLLREAIPEMSPAQRGVRVGVLDRFLNRMDVGDLVVTVNGPNVYVGIVASGVTWTESPGRLSSRRRAVDWANPDAPFRRDQLSGDAQDKLAGQLTVSDLGPWAVEFAGLAEVDGTVAEPAPAEASTEPAAVHEVELPDPTEELADQLLIDRDWLVETVDLLREKKQIILYGPPGTGKTFLAQELARYLTEQTGGAYRLVQFHPSYSYEDFFEGFRPRMAAEGSSVVGFALEPGPFKQMVSDAAEDISRAYILIIDEINRANLAKVFGELYFLLEYRNRTVQLQYSPSEEFRLPPNMFLIGTMNTADRSIALVDAAMRRRFYFQGLFPGEPPLDGLLRRWLHRHDLPEDRADLLDELNRAINDRDSAVGPSYLMTARVADDAGLARVWRTAIMPLMEERHIGEGTSVLDRYRITALRNRLGLPSSSEADTVARPDEPEEGEPT